MATFTVSATGGNWSSGTTWVGGVAPNPTGDDIIVPSGAGNLTVDINRGCLTIIFQTGYVNSFTISNGVTLTVSGATITLIAGMTYTTGTTGILSTLGNQLAISIAFNGITIPNLTIGKSSTFSNQTVTIGGTSPTIQNLVVTNVAANATTTLAGSPITITSSLNIGLGPLLGTLITFSGLACTISVPNTLGTVNGFTVATGSNLQMLNNINSIGPITFQGTATLNPGLFTCFMGSTTNSVNSATVTWYNFSYNVNGGTLTLLSNLNISNNLGHLNSVFSGAFNINIGGTTVSTSALQFNPPTIINFIGTGVIINGFSCQAAGGVVNINTSNPSGYTFGSVAIPNMILTNTTLNLVGTTVAQVFSSAHTLSIGGGSAINTNNTPTGANIVGGSQILWSNLSFGNAGLTVTQPSTFTGNLTVTPTLGAINGAKIFVSGNISAVGGGLQGTSIIEMNGSINRTISATVIQNSLIINKSGVGTKVTTIGNLTWGLANRTLTINSEIDFITNSTILTLSGTPLTINNTFGNNPFFRVNIPALTLNINGNPLRINENLTLTGLGATFAGAFGWDCNNLICATAGTFNIILQQGVTYRTRTAVSITGGVATTVRPTMRSSLANNYAIWTLDFGATQSLIYVNAIDIDSLGGQTIWSFGVIPLTDLIRTRNWNPGVPLRTVAYTFVN